MNPRRLAKRLAPTISAVQTSALQGYRFLRDLPSRLWRRLIESNYRVYEGYCRLRGYREERRRVSGVIGYEPDLRYPQTLNEKILWKKRHVRDPLLTRTTDKIEVRRYVREKLGDEADDLIIPILHVADTPGELPLEDCDPPYVIKANHSWNANLFVQARSPDGTFTAHRHNTPPTTWTRRDIDEELRRWLNTVHGFRAHEWAYQNIVPRLFIERYISGPDGGRLTEAKFDCFHGMPTYILLIVNEEETRVRTLLDAEGRRLAVRYGESEEVPEAARQMLLSMLSNLRRVAARLSEDFDYCRVDFYVTPGRPYFSEITHYPASGARRMTPQAFDREMGRHWILQSV